MIIGNLQLENNIFLAPMAGITDLAFRLMCKRWGAGLVYSEMVSSKAMHYKDKKTMELLQSHEDESPLAVQIFGSDPDIMAETAHTALSTGAKLLDINMGCPAPKVVKCGDGSSLLNNPQLIGKIVEKVSGAVNVPVTCKIRCGFASYDSAHLLNIVKIIEQGGASAICVHPRTREMYYSGKADWNIIKLVKENVTIPVIGNGDIFTAVDAKNMLDFTGCDGVMVARGAQGNPFIFRQIEELLTQGEIKTNPTYTERLSLLKEHIELLCTLKGEYIGVREARKHTAWYIKGLKNSSYIKDAVCKLTKLDDILKLIEQYEESLGELY